MFRNISFLSKKNAEICVKIRKRFEILIRVGSADAYSTESSAQRTILFFYGAKFAK